MKKILLVYPEVPGNTYWSFKHALPFVGKKSAMPPLGLITVAALFPDHYDLKLIDMNIEPLTRDAIQWADAVFVSAMIVQKASFRKVIDICNRLKTPVVAGGPYAASHYREISGVDHFVLGEVENTFKNFLMDWEEGNAPNVYPAGPPPDMTQTVMPRFDLLDLRAYSSLSIQYSRGCPFRCEFCDIWKTYGNRPRVKTGDAVVAELQAMYSAGWRGAVFIVDDNFIGNKKRVKKDLLPRLIAWQRRHRHVFRFFTEASINLAEDDELLEGLRDAGFNEVFIGIETPSKAALRETGKYQNLKINVQDAIFKIQRYGIEVMAGFILGFDSDRDDIFDRMIAFIQRSAIPQAMVGLLTALPGTELHRRLKKENRLLTETAGNNTHCISTNFKTRMDSGRLRRGYRKVIETLYDPNLKNYFDRCHRLLKNLGPTDLLRRDIHLREIVMLVKSVVRQPFTAYGLQYLKFITRNFIGNGRHFSEAVKFGIVGHHFHKMTRETLKAYNIAAMLEESYQNLREQLDRCADHSRETLKQIHTLWHRRRRMLKKIQARIDTIDRDFRDDIIAQYQATSARMRDLFTIYRKDLRRFGVSV